MPIRLLEPESDFPQVLELLNSCGPEPLSMTALLRWYQRAQPGRSIFVFVAADALDRVIGYCEVFHETWFPDGQYQVWVLVDPKQRRQGIGSALFGQAQAFLERQKAASLKSEMRENCPDGLRFAQKRGFTIERHQFEFDFWIWSNSMSDHSC